MNQRTSFAAILAVTLLVLAVLNELPRVFGGEPRGIVAFDSVKAVATRYGDSAWVPQRLPGDWDGSPSAVRVALGEPDWLQTRFGPRDEALTLCQTLQPAGSDEEPPQELQARGDVLQAERTMVAGRDARLRRVLLPDGAIVHELWWREREKQVMFRLRGSSEQLMVIARAAFGEHR